MGMRALVISHDPSEQPGLVGARLAHHGVSLDTFVVCDSTDDPVSHRPFPDVAGYDLLVVMGAPWSVYDTDTIGSWVRRELTLLSEAVERSVPVLGICFGAQALSAALGGTVERAPRPELGWHLIETTDDTVVAQGPWFQWHVDRFSVPPGGVELARSDVGVQAFRIGQSLGVQFHPEVDVPLLSSWLADGGEPDPLFAELGVDPRQVCIEAAWHEPSVSANACRLVDAFLDGVRR
jgi:GMP synthase-like glutamine amidotransferase